MAINKGRARQMLSGGDNSKAAREAAKLKRAEKNRQKQAAKANRRNTRSQ